MLIEKVLIITFQTRFPHLLQRAPRTERPSWSRCRRCGGYRRDQHHQHGPWRRVRQQGSDVRWRQRWWRRQEIHKTTGPVWRGRGRRTSGHFRNRWELLSRGKPYRTSAGIYSSPVLHGSCRWPCVRTIPKNCKLVADPWRNWIVNSFFKHMKSRRSPTIAFFV